MSILKFIIIIALSLIVFELIEEFLLD